MTKLTFSLCVVMTLGALASTASAQDAGPDAPAATDAVQARLNRLVVAHEVEDREPVGVGAPHYADGERVFVFVDVHNPDGPEGTLTLEWSHESGRVFAQTLDYGQSRRWRTWASRRMSERYAGVWRVEVLASDGRSLGELEFEVLPADEPSPAVAADPGVPTLDS